MATATLPVDPPDEAFGDTLASRGPVSAETPVLPSASRHHTVLPSLEWNGEVPQLSNPRARFEELGLLGAGGMGEVILARDHDIDRTVALKRLPFGVDMGAVLRFANEVRTVGSLEHPNIPPVHDVGVDASGRLYFVMKRVEGETLESVITRLRDNDPQTVKKFTLATRLQIVLGVLAAVAYAHKQGYVHRDLKPANIMLGPFGEVTVVDWGLAKKIRGPDAGRRLADAPGGAENPGVLQTQLGSVMGTPLYMAPEQARGEHDKVDERSDIYSAAVLLHELVTTQHYLRGRSSMSEVLEGVKTFSPPLVGTMPAEIAWFLKQGLDKDPAERFQSIDAMIAGLHSVIDGTFRMKCPRTMAKKLAMGVAKSVDTAPYLFLGGSAAVLVLAAVGVGKLLIGFMH